MYACLQRFQKLLVAHLCEPFTRTLSALWGGENVSPKKSGGAYYTPVLH